MKTHEEIFNKYADNSQIQDIIDNLKGLVDGISNGPEIIAHISGGLRVAFFRGLNRSDDKQEILEKALKHSIDNQDALVAETCDWISKKGQ